VFPQTLRDAHPEIPWSSIVAQRNILAHEYGEILVERVVGRGRRTYSGTDQIT
jgi:uncharacterized protein with HEPN domain